MKMRICINIEQNSTPFQNQPPKFKKDPEIPSFIEYNTEFRLKFPKIIDPESHTNSVVLRCFREDDDITECSSCDIKCVKN